MCLSSAVYSMFNMARYLFVAMGEVKTQARLDTLAVPARVAALLVAAPFGLYWVAWAVVFGALCRSALTYRYLARLTGMGWRQLLRAVRRSALLTALTMAGPVVLDLAGARYSRAHPLLALVAAALASGLLWLAGIVLFQHEVLAEWHGMRRRATGLPVE